MCGDLRPWRGSLCPWRRGDPFGSQSSACPKSPQKDACTLRCVFLYFFLARGHGSVGRAPPCQGGGRGFEPRCPLHVNEGPATRPALFIWRRGQVVRHGPAKPLPPVRIWASPPVHCMRPRVSGAAFVWLSQWFRASPLGLDRQFPPKWSREVIYLSLCARWVASVCPKEVHLAPWSLSVVPRWGSCRDYERVRAANEEDLAVARRKKEGKSPLVTSNGKTDANPGRG